MTLGKMKDADRLSNAASGANSLTLTNLRRFFRMICVIAGK